jgi:phosphatidate cytidylyltransferase
MNPVLKRTVTGIAAGLCVIALFLYCPLRALLPIMLALSFLAQLEFYQMVRRYEPVKGLGLAAGLLWIAGVGLYGFGQAVGYVLLAFAPFVMAVFLAVCCVVLFSPRFTRPIGSIAVTMAGIFYVPVLLSFFLLTVQCTGSGPWWQGVWTSRAGLYTLLAMIATAKFSDTGGFALGLAFGRHKMCPSISPKKSWEGLLGSMLFAAGTVMVFLAIARACQWAQAVPVWGSLTYARAAALGVVTAVAATIGDLIESRFKRECEIKDSATFMPAGMGGFLDMMDSTLFLPMILYPVLMLV